MSGSLSPKSPVVDFHGKRKHILQTQVLERQISLLQEELHSIHSLHPASTCCKQLEAFVTSTSDSDPFTPTNHHTHTVSKSRGFWNHIRLKLLFVVRLPWVGAAVWFRRKLQKVGAVCAVLHCPTTPNIVEMLKVTNLAANL